MTKRSDYKLSPRLSPYYQSLTQLERLRAHPAYAEGNLIEASAEAAFALHAIAAGQQRRKSVPRYLQSHLHTAVMRAVDQQSELPAPSIVPASDTLRQLDEAFAAAATYPSTADDEAVA